MNLYDIAKQVTDEVCGEGTYASVNRDNPDPGVQAAIASECTCEPRPVKGQCSVHDGVPKTTFEESEVE